MPSIASLLKDEISRLSRREIRRQTEPFKRASAAHRRHIAALKRQIGVLQKQLKSVSRGRAAATAATAEEGEAGRKVRFSAKGLKTLRARLDLSAAQFGKLVGVSGQSVYNWESEKAAPRRSQVAAIAALRGVGKREVLARLNGDGETPARRGRKPGTGKAAKVAKKKAPRKAAGVAKKAARKSGAAPRRKRASKAASDAS